MNLNEARPRLIKFQIKKNNKKWTIKNIETGNIYYILINEVNPISSIHDFLLKCNVYDEFTLPRTNAMINYYQFSRKIVNDKISIIWIPENKIQYIKQMYRLKTNLKEKKVESFKEYLKRST